MAAGKDRDEGDVAGGTDWLMGQLGGDEPDEAAAPEAAAPGAVGADAAESAAEPEEPPAEEPRARIDWEPPPPPAAPEVDDWFSVAERPAKRATSEAPDASPEAPGDQAPAEPSAAQPEESADTPAEPAAGAQPPPVPPMPPVPPAPPVAPPADAVSTADPGPAAPVPPDATSGAPTAADDGLVWSIFDREPTASESAPSDAEAAVVAGESAPADPQADPARAVGERGFFWNLEPDPSASDPRAAARRGSRKRAEAEADAAPEPEPMPEPTTEPAPPESAPAPAAEADAQDSSGSSTAWIAGSAFGAAAAASASGAARPGPPPGESEGIWHLLGAGGTPPAERAPESGGAFDMHDPFDLRDPFATPPAVDPGPAPTGHDGFSADPFGQAFGGTPLPHAGEHDDPFAELFGTLGAPEPEPTHTWDRAEFADDTAHLPGIAQIGMPPTAAEEENATRLLPFAGLGIAASAPATAVLPRAEADPGAAAVPPSEGGPVPGAPRAAGSGGGGRANRTLLWIAGGLVAAIALVGLFFLGTRLGDVVVTAATPTPTPTATPTPTPTIIPAPAQAQAPGTHDWDTLFGTECIDPFSSPWAEEFTVVDCANPHAAQLVYRGTLGEIDTPFPGEAELAASMAERCTRAGIIDLSTVAGMEDLQVQASFPVTEEQWTAGQRAYYCFASRSGGEPLTGSIAGPGPS
ncbi:septum formation family protein [Agromyces sp. SYSU T00194]|uniref:septum formation family protein n=1 Tax=Agromyces chitinivorans TaxID=3158560 RepID=UPI003390864C